MRRWFITVFALHFFFSVGFFASGLIDIHAPGENDNQALVALIGDVSDPTQKDDLLGAAPDHGLTDSQPDLPEFITPQIRVSAPDLPQVAPGDWREVHLNSPTLEGPQRPPRRHGPRA